MDIVKTAASYMKMRRFYRYLLKRALGSFLKPDFTPEQLEVHLIKGTIQITDILVNAEKLNETLTALGSPLRIQSGSVGKIRLRVPWANVLRDPCQLYVLDLRLNVIIETESIKKAGFEKPYVPGPSPEQSRSRFLSGSVKALSQLVIQVMLNIEACVENVILRIDEEQILFRIRNLVVSTTSPGLKKLSVGETSLQVGSLNDSVLKLSPFEVLVEVTRPEIVKIEGLIHSLHIGIPRRRTLHSLFSTLRKLERHQNQQVDPTMYQSVIEERVHIEQKPWYEEIYSVIEAEVTRAETVEGGTSLDGKDSEDEMGVSKTSEEETRIEVSLRVGGIRISMLEAEKDCANVSLTVKGLTLESDLSTCSGVADSVRVNIAPFIPRPTPSMYFSGVSESSDSSIYESVVDSEDSFGASDIQDGDADSMEGDSTLETAFFSGNICDQQNLTDMTESATGDSIAIFSILHVNYAPDEKIQVDCLDAAQVDLTPQTISNLSHFFQTVNACFPQDFGLSKNGSDSQIGISLTINADLGIQIPLGNGQFLSFMFPKPFIFDSVSGGNVSYLTASTESSDSAIQFESIGIFCETFAALPPRQTSSSQSVDSEVTWTAVKGRPKRSGLIPEEKKSISSKSLAEQSADTVHARCSESARAEMIILVKSARVTDNPLDFLNLQLRLQALIDLMGMWTASIADCGGFLVPPKSESQASLAISVLIDSCSVHALTLSDIALRVCFLNGLPLMSILIRDLDVSFPLHNSVVRGWRASSISMTKSAASASSSHYSCDSESMYMNRVASRFARTSFLEDVVSVSLEVKSLDKVASRICVDAALRGLHVHFRPSLILMYKGLIDFLAPPVTLSPDSISAPLITAPPRPSFTVYIVKLTDSFLEWNSRDESVGKLLVCEQAETCSGILSTVDKGTAAGFSVQIGRLTNWLARKSCVRDEWSLAGPESDLARNLLDHGFVPIFSTARANITVTLKGDVFKNVEIMAGSVRLDLKADSHNGLISAFSDFRHDIDEMKELLFTSCSSRRSEPLPSVMLPPQLVQPFVIKEDFVVSARGRGGSRLLPLKAAIPESVGAARWLIDPKQMVVVHDHLTVPKKQEQRLAQAKQEALDKTKKCSDFTLFSLNVKVESIRLFVHSGCDWEGSQFSVAGKRKRSSVCVEMEHFSLDLVHLGHASDCREEKLDLALTVNELRIKDGVAGSVYEYVLSHWTGPPSVQCPSAFSLGLCKHGSVAKAHVSLRPISITLDQDTLEFLSLYVAQSSNKDEQEETDIDLSEEGDSEESESANDVVESETEKVQDQQFLLQYLCVSSVHVEINYKSKRLSLSRLRRGDPLQILNLVPVLEGFQVVLSEIKMADVIDKEALLERLLDLWAKDINRAQILRSLSFVTPLKSFSNLSIGVSDLINQPLKQLRRKDGHLSRGLLRGVTSFIRTLTIESLNLADVVVSAAQNALECVESATGAPKVVVPDPNLSSCEENDLENEEWMTVEQGARERMLDPASALEGIRTGRDALIRGVKTAGLLQPAIGATQAVSVVLRGARSTVDSGRHRADTQRKYKRPYTHEEVLSDNFPNVSKTFSNLY